MLIACCVRIIDHVVHVVYLFFSSFLLYRNL